MAKEWTWMFPKLLKIMKQEGEIHHHSEVRKGYAK